MNKTNVLNEFIVQNIDSAYRFAFTYVKNREDAEDVVSESVIKALHNVGKLEKPENMKAWFYKIISNTALNFIKKRSRTVNADECQTALSSIDDYSEINLESILNCLDTKYREIVVLRFLEDMKISDIAKILETNENTVKTRLYKALKILRAEMEESEI